MHKIIKYFSCFLSLYCFSLYLPAKGSPVKTPAEIAPQGSSNEAVEPLTEESDEAKEPDQAQVHPQNQQDQKPAKPSQILTIEPAPGGGCTPGRCMAPYYSNEDGHVMRYVSGIGWRKFSPQGAQRKDWWDFKRTLPGYWSYR
jgi:hypothetical protein